MLGFVNPNHCDVKVFEETISTIGTKHMEHLSLHGNKIRWWLFFVCSWNHPLFWFLGSAGSLALMKKLWFWQKNLGFYQWKFFCGFGLWENQSRKPGLFLLRGIWLGRDFSQNQPSAWDMIPFRASKEIHKSGGVLQRYLLEYTFT